MSSSSKLFLGHLTESWLSRSWCFVHTINQKGLGLAPGCQTKWHQYIAALMASHSIAGLFCGELTGIVQSKPMKKACKHCRKILRALMQPQVAGTSYTQSSVNAGHQDAKSPNKCCSMGCLLFLWHLTHQTQLVKEWPCWLIPKISSSPRIRKQIVIVSTYWLISTVSVVVLLLKTGGGIQDCLSELTNKFLSISSMLWGWTACYES